ncbi:MAG: DUF5684 domain-containing protein [Polyangiaceae bacterium]
MSNMLMLAALFADAKTSGGGGGLLVWVLTVVGMWTVFTKAGQPGWAALIPIYNLYILFKVAGWSGLSLLLLLIPLVNVVVLFMVTLEVARKFGKGFLFTLGLTFLPFIFYPVLGLGSSTYAAYR